MRAPPRIWSTAGWSFRSRPKYAQLSREQVARTLDALGEAPDVICAGGWWLHETRLADLLPHVGYRGIATGRRDVLGRAVRYFSSSRVVDGRIYLRRDSERYRAYLCKEIGP